MADEYDPRDDFYKLLGLTAPTTTQAVQDAYRKQQELLHASDPKLRLVEAACRQLSDVVRRAAYDKSRELYLRQERLRTAGAGSGAGGAAAGSITGSGIRTRSAPPAATGAKSAKMTAYEPASESSLAAIEEQLRRCPDDMETLSWLAFQYYSSSILDKCIGAYTRYLQRRPSDADAHYYVARALQRSGRSADAVVHFRRVVELAPGTDRAAKAADIVRDSGS